MMVQRHLSLQGLHDLADVSLHTVVKPIFVVILVLQLEPRIQFFQGLKDLLAATKHLYPNGSCQLVVHVFIQDILLEDPFFNLMPNDEVLDDVNSVIEIGINLLLGESDPIRISGVTSHIVVVLDTVVLIEFVGVFTDIV
jgi:hypothetical protein